MKKLLITITFLFCLISIQAQKPFVLFGNVDKDLFSPDLTADRTVRATGDFLWSLDAVVSGAEITLVDNTFVTSLLSGVGAAVGYKFYKLINEQPVSTWGINLALLTKVKLNDIVDTRMKVALLANVYNFTLGPVYTFKDNQIGLLVGANIQF
jgi:hypothetical protein